MKNRIIRCALLLSLLSFTVIGCNKSTPDSGMGYIQVGSDIAVKTEVEQVTDTNMKSGEASLVKDRLFIVVTDAGGIDKLKVTYKGSSTTIQIPTGIYTVKAMHPLEEDYKDAAFEQPFFYGEVKNVEVIKDDITKVESTLICSIRNMKVSVEFGNGIKNEFASFYATVSIASDAEEAPAHMLRFDEKVTESGYFTAKPLTVYFYGVRKQNASDIVEFTQKITTNISPAIYHKIVLDMKYDNTTTVKTKSESGQTTAVEHKFYLSK